MGEPTASDRSRLEATAREGSHPPVLGPSADFAEGAQVAGHFLVDRPLGRGSFGEVFAVRDLALDRVVAMKVLRGAGGAAIARFMREARITARLDHPNVPPVYGLEFLPDGGLVFTMRRLEGVTLGDAIRQAATGEAPAAIRDVNAVVNLGLRLCEALSRAHALGIIHCDVKPDNVMLGGHGEVALVDWGECRVEGEAVAGDGSPVGTPAYMSPEQARGEPPDQRSDIYTVGATLFHVLAGQLPTFDAEPARFWEKKRAGLIDPLPAGRAARIPRPLLAIIERAMHADPARRYAAITELSADLERFQAGQAVAAYHEPLREFLARWLRRHRRDVLVATLILAVCAIAGGLLWREHLRRLADWGPPILVEDFADEGWRQRWIEAAPGQWTVQDGRLVTLGAEASYLVLDRTLSGAVAIEYEGEIPIGTAPGDLSVLWLEDLDVGRGSDPARSGNPARGYFFQSGAFGNYLCSIMRRPEGVRLDQAPLRLATGVRHAFRVELDGTSLSLRIDGQPVVRLDEPLPIGTGRLSLHGFFPGKTFDNIRVYQKRQPEMMSILGVGDAFLHDRQYVKAAQAYRRVIESHQGTELAQEARFRRGLCHRFAGDQAAMLADWDALPAGLLADRAAAYRLEDLMAEGREEEACDRLAALWLRQPVLRSQLRSTLNHWLGQLRSSPFLPAQMARVERLIDLKLNRLPPDVGSDGAFADMFLQLGRLDEVLQRFPDNMQACCQALIRLGRADEIAARFPGAMTFEVPLHQGRIDDLLNDHGLAVWQRTRALCQAGRAAEILTFDPASCMALYRLGRFAEALERARTPTEKAYALFALGRTTEALAVSGAPDAVRTLAMLADTADPRPGDGHGPMTTLAWRLVRLTAAEDHDTVGLLRQRLQRAWPDWDLWIAQVIIDPLLSGDRDRLRQRLDDCWRDGKHQVGQRAWHVAGLALGHLDAEALSRMPTAAEAELWLTVGLALRATLAQQPDLARRHWSDYLALPWERRIIGTWSPDPALDVLARHLVGNGR